MFHTKYICVPYTTNDAVACQTQPTNISWRPNDSMSIQQQCNAKRGRMEISAPTNSKTDYPPSYKARPLCRTEVIKEEMAEKRVKASPVNIKFTSEEDGKGAWSRILRDPQLYFNANRSRDSLRMRADSCAFRILMKCN